MTRYLADTNIFIAAFKGDDSAARIISEKSPGLDSVVYLELIQGAKNKHEINKIESFLSSYSVYHFDRLVSLRSIELVRKYSKSNGLMLPDAVIAASCLENDLTLITRNTKHFSFIDSLRLYRERK